MVPSKAWGAFWVGLELDAGNVDQLNVDGAGLERPTKQSKAGCQDDHRGQQRSRQLPTASAR